MNTQLIIIEYFIFSKEKYRFSLLVFATMRNIESERKLIIFAKYQVRRTVPGLQV